MRYYPAPADYLFCFSFVLEESQNASKQNNPGTVLSSRYLAFRPSHDDSECEPEWWRIFWPGRPTHCFAWHLHVPSFHIHYGDLRWNVGRTFAYQCPFALGVGIFRAYKSCMSMIRAEVDTHFGVNQDLASTFRASRLEYSVRNRNGASMKYFIVAGVLVALAVLIRFVVLLRFGVDIHIHDTYWVVPLCKIAFWLLLVIASVWFLIGAYRFIRHSS